VAARRRLSIVRGVEARTKIGQFTSRTAYEVSPD
jgi:hypothetical protein